MKIFQTVKLIFFVFALFILSRCKKFVEPDIPADRTISAQVFTSDSKATSAVTAIYGEMINDGSTFGNRLITVCSGYSADELIKFTPEPSEQEFIDNQLSPNNGINQNIWRTAYKTIYNANAVIEGLSNSSSITTALKDQLLGECKFLRAFSYFYIINTYGDAPLVLNTDYRANSITPRTEVVKVYDQIISDLSDAKKLLLSDYPSQEKVRANKWTATALLSRVYLYIGDWEKAELNSTEVINSNLYTPLPSLPDVFLKDNTEAIWQLQPLNLIVPELEDGMYPIGGPQIVIAPELLNSFDVADLRRTYWIDSIDYSGSYYYYPGKYKDVSASATEYYVVFRCSEQYLIRAEARAQQNKITEAVLDLNIIRTRAGLSEISSSSTQTETLYAIETERRFEFFAEWGHRWFDLKRTNRVDDILSTLKPNWQTTDRLYPIPLNEILTNTFLTQNQGY